MSRYNRTNLPADDAPSSSPAGISAHRFVDALRTFIDMTAARVSTLELAQLLTTLEDGIPALAQVGEHQATVAYPEPMPEATTQELAARLGLKLTRRDGVDCLTPA
jgi:hypothetical protein